MLQELFEFGDLTAGQVMMPRVRTVGIPLGASPEEVRELLGRSPHTRYPIFVGDFDHILGFVHIKDLLRLLMQNESIGRIMRGRCRRPERRCSTPSCRRCARADADGDRDDEHGGTAGVTLAISRKWSEIDEGPTAPTIYWTRRAAWVRGRPGSTSWDSSRPRPRTRRRRQRQRPDPRSAGRQRWATRSATAGWNSW